MKIGNQKSYQSWTLSNEFWNRVSWLIPTYQRSLDKEYKRSINGKLVGGENHRITEKYLRVYFTSSEPAVSGKQYRQNLEKAVISTDIFSFGNKPDSSKPFGHTH